ncbi:MAG: c-type cytochrome domain-containing protein [Verrucomicrobiota bacterium]
MAIGLPIEAAAVNFERQILPIFQAKCIECHKAPFEEDGKLKKPKAGLRMDAAWAIQAGSENGSVLIAGDPEESELYYRVTLPEDDSDFMPPTGKADPLNKRELTLFRKWIEEGADFGGWAGNLEGKPIDTTSTKKEPVSEIQEIYKRLASDMGILEDNAWEPVTAAGGRVTRLAQGSPLLAIDFRLTSETATDEAIGSISVVAPNVIHLDLSETAITDDALSILSQMPELVRLNLSQSQIGDPGLKYIQNLKELRYLNLYQSQVTDAGLKNLHDLESLESVYLWGSGVTEAGAKALAKALPNAKISFR